MSTTRPRGRLSLPAFVAIIAAMALCPVSVAGLSTCPADFDGSGDVGFNDLVSLLAAWGPCPGCLQDLDDSGDVGFTDLLQLLASWGDCPETLATPIELAGNPLTQYPYFEFIRAVNEGAVAAVAIDPVDLAEGGGTAAVYIVAARTEAEWASNTTLTDVRGAPQSVDFTGATIQANTQILTGSAALDADAGTGLGVGYDVVCDFNQNGELDAGDYIDGLSDESGFYVVKDPASLGPLAVTTISYSVKSGSVTGGFEQQRTYYPTDIASMGELPLVTISHGNGHQYTWYDYLGEHLASYGYIVMSHRNNTGPGIETASTTTYEHTDAFLGQLATIGGGALVGHVDSHRITWIGHSRGGEGVARAYTRVDNGSVVPENYLASDVVVVSSIAPNNSLGAGTQPNRVNYHLLWGSADGDISGSGTGTGTWSFSIYERAIGFRQSTYLHGADHNDFNCCGFEDFTGPAGTAVGRPEAQQVAKAVYLVLIKRYIEDNVPALDYLWRQYERFRPPGVAATTTVVSEYNEGVDSVSFAIDDFQDQTADLATSSSGGAVTGDVQNRIEQLMQDSSSGYGWTPADPMNGMSRTNSGGDTWGSAFDWSAGDDRFLEFAVVPGERDFSDDLYLSLRACQGTQHPETTAELGDLTFTVTLRDGSGTSSSINFGAYGGGIEEVYQRSNGWQNEFETVRMRVRDFRHNGSGLDLTDIVAVRLDFGDAHGSARGRLGFDDLVLSNDPDVPPTGLLAMSLPDGVPTLIPPGVETDISVRITATGEAITPDSTLLHYRYDGGVYQTMVMTTDGDNIYTATLPAAGCSDTPEFFFSAQGSFTGKLFIPETAPADTFTAGVGVVLDDQVDDFETDTGWTAENLGATSGDWDRGVPVNDPGWAHDPESDGDGSGQCYLTQNTLGNSDVDNGAVRLTSPVFDMSAPDLLVGYLYYLKLTVDDGDDRLLVEANNGSSGWQVVIAHDTDGGLEWRDHMISGAELTAAGAAPSSTMQMRFTVNDDGEQSIVEGGLDGFHVFTIECE